MVVYYRDHMQSVIKIISISELQLNNLKQEIENKGDI